MSYPKGSNFNRCIKVANSAALVNTLNNIDNTVGINIVKRTIFKFPIRKINARNISNPMPTIV